MEQKTFWQMQESGMRYDESNWQAGGGQEKRGLKGVPEGGG